MSSLLSKKTFKAFLGIALTLAILASFSLLNAGLNTNAATLNTTVAANDSHNVVEDVMTDAARWKKFASSPTVTAKDGKLSFDFATQSTKDNSMYVVDESGNAANTMNQRVKATYSYHSTNNNVFITLFSRYGIVNVGGNRNVGYCAKLSNTKTVNSDTSYYTRVTVSKWTVLEDNTWKNDIVLGYIDVPYNINMWNGGTLSLEMVVTSLGNGKSSINVNLYKNTTIAATTTIIDDDKYLNENPGAAAVSAGSNCTIELSNFEYTTTDNVAGNNLLGNWENANLYQRLPVVPGKTYVIEALVSETGDYTALDNPFFAKYITGVESNSASAATKQTDISMTKSTDTFDDEFNHRKFEFTVPADAAANNANSYMCDSAQKYFVMCDIGLSCTTSKGLYTNVKVYAKDDTSKSNLLVNGDFKMGRYGWVMSASHPFCFFAGDNVRLNESLMIGLDNKNVKATSSLNYAFFGQFKNPSLEQGDVNLDKSVDICDLVALNIRLNDTAAAYLGTADMDTNNTVNSADFPKLRTELLK